MNFGSFVKNMLPFPCMNECQKARPTQQEASDALRKLIGEPHPLPSDPEFISRPSEGSIDRTKKQWEKSKRSELPDL